MKLKQTGNPSGSSFHRTGMPLNLSDEHLARIKEKFRQSLGRELTPEELRYLGLSLVALPDYEPLSFESLPEFLDEVA